MNLGNSRVSPHPISDDVQSSGILYVAARVIILVTTCSLLTLLVMASRPTTTLTEHALGIIEASVLDSLRTLGKTTHIPDPTILTS